MAFPLSLSAQVSGGTSAGAGSVGSVGAARSAGVVGVGAVSPSASLAGQPVAIGQSGQSAVSPSPVPVTPSQTPIATPGTATPVGTLNPGGLAAQPPIAVGRTFDRPIIGGGPTPTVVDPTGVQPTFRFPPSSTLPTPVITNTTTVGAGRFPASTFPPGPVSVGGTANANTGAGLPTAVPREPVAINLPPGARIATNSAGVSEVLGPQPVLVPTNIGRAPGLESGIDRGVVIPRTVPPTEVPQVSRGPILDRRAAEAEARRQVTP